MMTMINEINEITLQMIALIKANLRNELKEELKAELLAEMRTTGEIEPSEVHGRANIARVLGCSCMKVTEMVKHGALGRALWKNGRTNGTMTLDTKKGKSRYAAFAQMEWTEQKAWCCLNAQQAEAEWQRMKM